MRTRTNAVAVRQVGFRPLTKSDIDRRIHALAEQLVPAPDRECIRAGATTVPRWISADELVRRMRPFIVLN